MVMGLAEKLNRARWRATLQPPFKYRDTELNPIRWADKRHGA
jgi:hypothetical protein